MGTGERTNISVEKNLKEPRNIPHKCNLQIFDKEQMWYNEAKIVSSTNYANVHILYMNIETDVSAFTKINSEWIIYLNVKFKLKTLRRQI